MFKYKNVMTACFIEYFLCLFIYVVYTFFEMDAPTRFMASVCCGALFVLPLLLCAIKKLRRMMPYIFNIFFIASCLLLAIMTETPVYMPLVFVTLAITMCFFLDPRINVWLTALTNIVLLLMIFLYPFAIERFVPLTVFVLSFVVYDFAMVSMIILVYTFRKNVNVLQRRLTAALRTDHRKNAFWESAAHEIHTPINVINGLCQLLLRGDISNDVRERTYEIQAAGKDLLVILNSAFDYTNLETHRLKIAEESYIFTSMLNDIVNFCSTKVEYESVDFIVDCDPNIPYELIGDNARISQVILSLFANAVKYTKSGSITLGFSARRTESGANLRISVSDTGTGIEPAKMSKIFTVYSEGNGTTKLYSTHLGLGISKELVTLMGGFINVESAVGKGSTFTVTIPQKIKEARPFVEISSPEKIYVLMFTERTHLKEIMQKQFSALGIRMTYCTSQNEFMVEKENPDYTHIFTDYNIFTFNRPIFDILSQRVEIVVPKTMSLRDEKTPPYVKSVFCPLYAASLASVFNNEKSAPGSAYTVSFTAPQAAVLIVDDSIVNIKVANTFLKPYNMTVFTADNGYDAYEIVKNHHIDLVFMDHVMPHPDGIETTKKIRRLEGDYFKNLPIIALTANTQNDIRTLFIENEMNDFVSKPIELRSLENVLRKWLPENLVVSLDKPVEINVGELPQKHYQNFEPKNGILNVGGNKEAFNDILETFVVSYEEVRRTLESALHERNFELYAITVHALKGASRNIGAENLSEFARQLEAAAKQNEITLLTERTPLLFNFVETTNESIYEYFNDNDIRMKKTPNYSVVLPQVEEAVERSDASAAKTYLEELLECKLSDVCKRHAEKALGYVNNFNFSGAAKELRRLNEAAK